MLLPSMSYNRRLPELREEQTKPICKVTVDTSPGRGLEMSLSGVSEASSIIGC